MKLTSQKVIFLTILFVSVASNQWSTQEQNMQQENQFVELQPIRMTYDISNIKLPNKQLYKKFESLIETIVNFMKKFIKVKPLSGANIFPSNKKDCVEIQVKSDDKIKGIKDSDLHIYFKNEKVIHYNGMAKPDFIAQAGLCGIIQSDQQHPYFGGIDIQTKYILDLQSPDKFQYLARIMLHELLHILGFNQYVTDKMVIYNLAFEQFQEVFITENVLIRSARKYFGCDTLHKVSINESHWNPNSFFGEVIALYGSDSMFISIMTVMYLKAIREWGDVNENFAEYYNTRDKGCHNINNFKTSPSHNTEYDFKCEKGCDYNGICIRGICHCNPGFFGEDCSESCTTNESTKQCDIKCPPNNFVNPDNTCKETCPRGYYPDDQRCKLCDFSCSACDGPLKNNCTACQYLSHFYEESHSCNPCESDQYEDQRSKECKDCFPECLSCDNQYECTVCIDGYHLQDKQCVSNVNIEQCTGTGCKSCHPKIPKQCLTCEKGYFLKQNECFPCRIGCASCTKLTDCNECEANFSLQIYGVSKNSQYKICHFKNNKKCFPPCYGCIKQRNRCTSCMDRYRFKRNKCFLIECGVGFFRVSNRCMKCDPSCKECSQNAQNCTKCHHPIKLQPGRKCV